MDTIQKDPATKRMFWVEHRTEAYIGARYLINRAFHSSAFMLASYSVEFSFKQLIGEYFDFADDKIKALQFSKGNMVVKSHNLEAIYDRLVEENIIDDILSKKFLKELTTEAERYPTPKITAWNHARALRRPQAPLIMYYLDSIFTKIDYFMLARHHFKPESNSSAFVRALCHSGCDNYFAFNIHARHYYDQYCKVLGDSKIAYGNKMCQLKDINRDSLYWNENCDIKKDSEPIIPDPAANIAKYDDLSF